MAANKFAPPQELDQVVAEAQAKYNWSNAEAKDAKDWYVRFLQLRWEDFSPLYVMSHKADLVWHLHLADHAEAYKAYCAAMFGQLLTHQEVANPHVPSASQQTDAENRYKKHNWWPIPDSWTGCA